MQNIKSSGTQTIDGGIYGTIRVLATFIAQNDVQCQEIKISGTSTFKGNLQCYGKAHFSGSVHCLGEFNSNQTHISGSLTCAGAKGNSLAVSGTLRSMSDIEVENIKVSGSVYANNIRSKSTYIDGNVVCNGDIKSDDIHIKMYFRHEGEANSIECKNLLINSNWTKNLIGTNVFFNTSIIKGDDINIDYVRCEKISGKKIKIGKHCIVQTVEYTDCCDILDGAEVKEKKHVSNFD